MAQAKQKIIEGETEPIKHVLKSNGVALEDTTGFSVELVLTDCNGDSTTYSDPDVGFTVAGGAEVYFNRSASAFLKSKEPYTGTWMVTDDSGNIAGFPLDVPILFTVRKP